MRVSILCTALILLTFGLASAQDTDTNFGAGPQYLVSGGSPYFARSIATPSISLAGPALEQGASAATAGLIAGAENQMVVPSQPDVPPAVNLFPIYYGAPARNVIEISFSENPAEASSIELPESILDTGVSQVTTAEGLRARGYGVTVAQAAANSKANAQHAPRTYTNADIDRLHGTN
jgi:hypothetical protein